MTETKYKRDNKFERTVTAIAAAIVFFVLGFLIFQIITEEETPPNIHVSFGEVVQKDNGYSVPVIVKNAGTQTAKNIAIEIEFDHHEKEQNGQIGFDFLPGKSIVRGWVTFKDKPAISELKPKILGYSVP